MRKQSLSSREGGQAIAVSTDIIDLAAVENALTRVATELGPVDILINNYGSFRGFGFGTVTLLCGGGT
ncbi:SDR family NAD(P)-dependent oxidoreductase [Rhizobium sophorae]|uniref:SDR family NAD(P)-dependent oxidoreductase n=1 Tax=Rhizobium sophorae TaxID=1535242 RepID=UPI00248397C1|nr:SDR family NAD(P)-dependent oxidoreductase [Rhizobium sophorae]